MGWSASASLGYVLYPNDSTDADELILLADKAMYQAKANGGGAIQSYQG